MTFITQLIEQPRKKDMQQATLAQDGSLGARWSEFLPGGRPVAKSWLYEIVSNWRHGGAACGLRIRCSAVPRKPTVFHGRLPGRTFRTLW